MPAWYGMMKIEVHCDCLMARLLVLEVGSSCKEPRRSEQTFRMLCVYQVKASMPTCTKEVRVEAGVSRNAIRSLVVTSCLDNFQVEHRKCCETRTRAQNVLRRDLKPKLYS